LIGAILIDWNSEYVIYEDAYGKHKIPSSQFFPHRGWTKPKKSKDSVSKVLTSEEALLKDQRYLKSLKSNQKSQKQRDLKQSSSEKPETKQPEPAKPKKEKYSSPWD
jgi:hypothetical protein